MRKEDPAPYPARLPLTLLATPKTVFLDTSRLLSLFNTTLDLYTIHVRFSFRFGHSSQTQTF